MISRQNKIIKECYSLKIKKYRDNEQKFIIEGIRFIEEAIKAGVVQYILYSKKIYEISGYEKIFNTNIEKYEVDESTINDICDTQNPQGVIAVVKKIRKDMQECNIDSLVIINGVQDPGNMGTIIRTCDAAGISAIAIIKGSVDVYNSKTLRATMGSIFHIPLYFYDTYEEAVDSYKSKGFIIYATSLKSNNYIYDCDFKLKTAITVGNEANGICDEEIIYADKTIKIPMIGKAESLNAASASAIIIYEIVRQRLTK